MKKIKDPCFRGAVLDKAHLAKVGITLETVASECLCSCDALRKYRKGEAQPGGVILGRMAQCFARRGQRVTMGWLMGIEPRPR